MFKYFFTLTYNGVNKNGNSTYKVTGFKMGSNPYEFIPLPKCFMEEIIGGRWNYKTESITTQQSVQQIIEKLNNNVKDFAFGIVRG